MNSVKTELFCQSMTQCRTVQNSLTMCCSVRRLLGQTRISRLGWHRQSRIIPSKEDEEQRRKLEGQTWSAMRKKTAFVSNILKTPVCFDESFKSSVTLRECKTTTMIQIQLQISQELRMLFMSLSNCKSLPPMSWFKFRNLSVIVNCVTFNH